MVRSLALCPDNAKQDSVVYGAEFGVVFLEKGPSTGSIQEGLDCLGRYYSGLEGKRYIRLVVELLWVPPDAHPACVGPPDDSCSGIPQGQPSYQCAIHRLDVVLSLRHSFCN